MALLHGTTLHHHRGKSKLGVSDARLEAGLVARDKRIQAEVRRLARMRADDLEALVWLIIHEPRRDAAQELTLAAIAEIEMDRRTA